MPKEEEPEDEIEAAEEAEEAPRPISEGERVRRVKGGTPDIFDEMLGTGEGKRKPKGEPADSVSDSAETVTAEAKPEGRKKRTPAKPKKPRKERKRAVKKPAKEEDDEDDNEDDDDDGDSGDEEPDKEYDTLEGEEKLGGEDAEESKGAGKEKESEDADEPEETTDDDETEEEEPETASASPDKEIGTTEEGVKEQDEDWGWLEHGEKEIGAEPELVQGKVPGLSAGANEEFEKMRSEKRNAIKETILMKAEEAGKADRTPEHQGGVRLGFLGDAEKKNVFIGMKKGVWKKYGYEGALHIGRVNEQEYKDAEIFLDSLNPHVVFVCGARGSGKSYVMGVLAEEIALKNRNVGVVVVDPVGVFWSMKFPNREDRELKRLAEWGMKPRGLDNIKVFIPSGKKNEVPKSTYNEGFSMQPSLLTADDWCLTFGIERFSPSGLLLDKMLKKVEKGYKKMETGKEVKGKETRYSLDDIVECLEYDDELNSKERGYKQDSIRALVSRFEAAKSWGIFDEKGTPLSELSRAGQLTILDTSFLDDVVTALVIGILARRLLAARKISTRKEAAQKFKKQDLDELLELEVPPTWLFIDEAHTLIPSGNTKTPATSGLVEYVKQGRRPGCSLVFATQQPSAIDTKVLSQLDVVISHKLVFDDDIKAVYRRIPTIVPGQYKRPTFIKTLPVGVALTGDRSEETTRAFIMSIRPRMSQHEGRDAETNQMNESMDDAQVMDLAAEMVGEDISRAGKLDKETMEQVVRTLNSKYKTALAPAELMKELGKRGFEVSGEGANVKGYEEKEEAEEESAEELGDEEETKAGAKTAERPADAKKAAVKGEEELDKTELLSLPQRIDGERARAAVDRVRKRKMLGLLGDEERISGMEMRHVTVWRVGYDIPTKRGEFLAREAFIDSRTGEFLHFDKGKFVESKGLGDAFDMGRDDIVAAMQLANRRLSAAEVARLADFDEAKAKRVLGRLAERGIAGTEKDKKTGKDAYFLKKKFDLPPNEMHEMLGSLNKLPFVRVQAAAKERERFSRDSIPNVLRKLWPHIMIRRVDELYRPVWFANLELKGKERRVAVDAVTGEVI